MTNQISTVAKQYFYWFFIQRTGKEGAVQGTNQVTFNLSNT